VKPQGLGPPRLLFPATAGCRADGEADGAPFAPAPPAQRTALARTVAACAMVDPTAASLAVPGLTPSGAPGRKTLRRTAAADPQALPGRRADTADPRPDTRAKAARLQGLSVQIEPGAGFFAGGGGAEWFRLAWSSIPAGRVAEGVLAIP
jgi:hypothetical protein